MLVDPRQIEIRKQALSVGPRTVRPGDVTGLTYWTVERIRKESTITLKHEFLLALAGEGELGFEVDVLHPDLEERRRRARTAAAVVEWLQTQVEARVRAALLDQVAAGATVSIGGCDLTTEGFAHTNRLRRRTTHPWGRYRGCKVTKTSIEVVLTTDDPERGERGFGVSRSALNAVMLPELLADGRDRWAV